MSFYTVCVYIYIYRERKREREREREREQLLYILSPKYCFFYFVDRSTIKWYMVSITYCRTVDFGDQKHNLLSIHNNGMITKMILILNEFNN